MDRLWRIQLLGPFRADAVDGTVVTRFQTHKAAVLLARLALYPRRAHAREELIDLLWPDAAIDAGRLSLRVAIASLRRQLEPPGVPVGSVLVADRSFVRLNPASFRTDVGEFEDALSQAAHAIEPTAVQGHWRRAASLYVDDLLPGFYDDWISDERSRLSALLEQVRSRIDELDLPEEPIGKRAPSAAVDAQQPDAPRRRLLGLPIQFTRFFGREQETTEIQDLLATAQTRLVTLSGAGGSGKTRLAVEVASQSMSGSGPICFVPLADLTDAASIPSALASALGLPPSAERAPLEQAIDALAAEPPALLILDNFEHLVERGAPLVLTLMTRVPTVTCLVTSRRRLKLPGEREYPVQPLPIPTDEDAAEDVSPSQIARAASVRLFLDRAQAARPDFQLTRGNAAAVATLCRKLEGVPLALELVASRALVLTPAQMSGQLTRHLSQLEAPGRKSGAHRANGVRHRSLWAAMAWGYGLIPAPLQRFFARLSVFQGGCTVEAAQAVCDEPQALEYLTQLRERSLILVDDAASGEARFRLLETLREFASEQLLPDELEDAAQRHADFFLRMSEETYSQLFGPDQADLLVRLEADHGNLRLALAYWLTGESADEAMRMAGSLWRFWAVRGHYAEARDLIDRALAQTGGTPALRAKAANGAGNLARSQGEYDVAEALFTQALTIMRAENHQNAIGVCLCNIGMVAMHRMDYERAEALYEESLRLRREIGDRYSIAFTLQCYGLARLHQKDYAHAERLFREGLAIWDEMGDAGGRMWAIGNIATTAAALNNNTEATRLFRDALRLSLELSDQVALLQCLTGLSELAYRSGAPQRAIVILGAVDALFRRTGIRLPPQDAAHHARIVSEAQAALPASEWTPLWAQGQILSGPQAAAYALEETFA